jgi:hypothetical protein
MDAVSICSRAVPLYKLSLNSADERRFSAGLDLVRQEGVDPLLPFVRIAPMSAVEHIFVMKTPQHSRSVRKQTIIPCDPILWISRFYTAWTHIGDSARSRECPPEINSVFKVKLSTLSSTLNDNGGFRRQPRQGQCLLHPKCQIIE